MYIHIYIYIHIYTELLDGNQGHQEETSQDFQCSAQWQLDRDALSRHVASLAEAGIREKGAFNDFLQKTPLPDRNNSDQLSQVQYKVEQLAFNAKLQSCVVSQTPQVTKSASQVMEEG